MVSTIQLLTIILFTSIIISRGDSQDISNGQQTNTMLLQNLCPDGVVTFLDGTTGTIQNIVVNITNINVQDVTTLVILFSGILDAQVLKNGVVVNIYIIFQNVPGTLVSNSGQKRQLGSCSILTLSLGGIQSNLLGLSVVLQPVNLVLSGLVGSQELLGSLLCTLIGLLNSIVGEVLGIVSSLLPLSLVGSLLSLINPLLGVL